MFDAVSTKPMKKGDNTKVREYPVEQNIPHVPLYIRFHIGIKNRSLNSKFIGSSNLKPRIKFSLTK